MSDVTRLPKWAQQRIKILELELHDIKGQLKQVSSGESPVYWEDGLRDYTMHGIPERAAVVFRVQGGTLDVNLRDGRIQIRGTSGRTQIDVRPEAGNAISVGMPGD